MTIATVVYALVFGTLVAAAAAALDACCRLGKRATRGVWIAALGVTLACTALTPARTLSPSGPVPATLVATSAVPRAPSIADRIVQAVSAVRFAALRSADRALARIPAARVSSLDRWVAVGWAGVSVVVLTLLIAVHAHFRRARRAWPLATLDGTSVRMAPRTGPAVIGFVNPEIVVPEWLMTRARLEQHLVLDHEREHLRARDPLVLSAAYVATALMPWHPAVWWMLARVRLAVELDCDARVLRRGVTPGSYGALLIELAGRGAGRSVVPALGLTLTSLERRLIAMTPYQHAHSRARRSLLAATALLALAIACSAPVPTSPHQVYSVTVPDAHLNMLPDKTALLVMPGDSVVYHIDGALASAVQVESLSVHDVPRTMLVRASIGKNVRKHVEFWITTEMPGRPKLAHGSTGAKPMVVIDQADAIREKIQVDSAAAAAMAHTKHADNFTGQVLIDGRPATMLTLKELPPNLIQSIDITKRADSTRTISVNTKSH